MPDQPSVILPAKATAAWPIACCGAAMPTSIAYEVDVLSDPDPIVRLQRHVVCDAQVIATATVWSLRPGDTAEAERCRTWMLGHPQDWSLWALVASIAGPANLADIVRAGVAAGIVRERDKVEADRREAERDAELHRVIESFLVERKGRFGVTLERGDATRPFWSVMFREKWERERFRDWWNCQRHRFAEFAEYLESHEPLDLERLVLAEMLATEKAVKAAGLGAGGRRPLRFWRGRP